MRRRQKERLGRHTVLQLRRRQVQQPDGAVRVFAVLARNSQDDERSEHVLRGLPSERIQRQCRHGVGMRPVRHRSIRNGSRRHLHRLSCGQARPRWPGRAGLHRMSSRFVFRSAASEHLVQDLSWRMDHYNFAKWWQRRPRPWPRRHGLHRV